MVRTSEDGGRGISCLLVDAKTPGLSASPPERKMGLKSFLAHVQACGQGR